MDRKLEIARQNIQIFKEKVCGLQILDEPAYQGQTNRVLFGSYNDELVAIKYYSDPSRREQEVKALTLMRSTAVVPELVPLEDPHIMVTKRIEGDALALVYDSLSQKELDNIYLGMGAALASIEQYSLHPMRNQQWERHCKTGVVDLNYYRHSAWPDFVNEIIKRCLHAMDAHDLRDSELIYSIEAISDYCDAFVEFEMFFMGSDFGSNNMIVNQGHFQRFVDLEMSRYANAIYLVGTGMFMVWRQSPHHLDSLVNGYLDASGRTDVDSFLRLCRVYAPFSYWVNFAWYFNMDKLPPWAVATNHKQKILNLITSTVSYARIIEI